jgi:hypothetical protein
MPNGTLDGFNHVLDFDEGLTYVFRISATLFLRQSFRDVAAVRNLSISRCDQLLNVLVVLSHSDGFLLSDSIVIKIDKSANKQRSGVMPIASITPYCAARV